MLNIGKERKSRQAKLVLLFFVILTVLVVFLNERKQIYEEIIEAPILEEVVEEIEIPLTTEEIIRKIAKEREWNDNAIDILVKIAYCESRFDDYAIGFNDNGTIDRGLFQFNSYWRKDVSNKCAFNIECATNEAINTANRNGNFNAWACYRKIK